MHDMTVSRPCRDGETWKNAYSFGPAELLPMAKALNIQLARPPLPPLIRDFKHVSWLARR